MRTVFFDVDTQLDFLSPSGALYVPGAEQVTGAIARLDRWASEHGVPLISTLDTHAGDDDEFRRYHYPAHCVRGTIGWAKPAGTLLDRRVTVPVGPLESAPPHGAQILLEKHTFDCFSNPALPGILAAWGAERYVVYGVVTEVCVADAAMGLLATGARVAIVADAVRQLSDAKAAAFLDKYRQAGGALTTVAEVTGT